MVCHGEDDGISWYWVTVQVIKFSGVRGGDVACPNVPQMLAGCWGLVQSSWDACFLMVLDLLFLPSCSPSIWGSPWSLSQTPSYTHYQSLSYILAGHSSLNHSSIGQTNGSHLCLSISKGTVQNLYSDSKCVFDISHHTDTELSLAILANTLSWTLITLLSRPLTSAPFLFKKKHVNIFYGSK